MVRRQNESRRLERRIDVIVYKGFILVLKLLNDTQLEASNSLSEQANRFYQASFPAEFWDILIQMYEGKTESEWPCL